MSIVAPIEQTPADLISAREAAGLAGVHFSTIIRWVQKGVIRGWQRPDGSYRVSRSEVTAAALVPVTPRAPAAGDDGADTEAGRAARGAATRARLRARGWRV